MPTYEYRCPKGHSFDLFQRMSDDPGADCPECGEAAERQISGGSGFLFKGDGFYITDYRSADYKKKASAESGGGKSGDGGSTGGSGDSAGPSKKGGAGGSKGDSAGSSGGSGGKGASGTGTSGKSAGGSGSSSGSE